MRPSDDADRVLVTGPAVGLCTDPVSPMPIGKLSILVPVYNEVATVEQLLRRVADVEFPIEREIVVVDDGSTDGSGDVLRRLSEQGLIRYFVHAGNQGKGAAVRTAAEHATGDVVVIQDADLELEPNDLPTLLAPILLGETEVCYGTRFAPPVPRAIRRLTTYWGNRVLNFISNRLNGLHISDCMVCYKMFVRGAASRLDMTESGFAVDSEITAKLAKLGYSITERPIHYRPRTVASGKKIRTSDAFTHLLAMFRYRFFWSARRVPTARAAPIPTTLATPVAGASS